MDGAIGVNLMKLVAEMELITTENWFIGFWMIRVSEIK